MGQTSDHGDPAEPPGPRLRTSCDAGSDPAQEEPVAKVTMPQLGESVAEGTIGRWLKKPGDRVEKYESIVEVITDKVNAEVPSPFAGTLTAILVGGGGHGPQRHPDRRYRHRGCRRGRGRTGRRADSRISPFASQSRPRGDVPLPCPRRLRRPPPPPPPRCPPLPTRTPA